MAAKHPRSVADRLAATELREARFHDHGMATELSYPSLEGDPGPGRRLVAEDRNRSRPGKRAQPIRLSLERVSKIQDRELLRCGEIVVDQEVSHNGTSATWSRRDGSAPMKLSS